MAGYRLLAVICLADRDLRRRSAETAERFDAGLQARAERIGVKHELGVCQHCGRRTLVNAILLGPDGEPKGYGPGCARKLGVRVPRQRRRRPKRPAF